MRDAVDDDKTPDSTFDIPAAIEDLTPDWLTLALHRAGAITAGRVAAVHSHRIGTDTGFSSFLTRLDIDYSAGTQGGPASLIVKLPSLDRQMRAWLELYQGYEREIRFYEQLADRCTLGTPRCFYAAMDAPTRGSARSRNRKFLQRLPAWVLDALQSVALRVRSRSKRRYTLLLEDLADRRMGDQIAGATLEDARTAARAAADLHADFWGDRAAAEFDWIPKRLGSAEWARSSYRRHSGRFYRELDDGPPEQFRRIMDWADRNLEDVLTCLATAPSTLLHGDYQLDNLFFEGNDLRAIDWSSVSLGPGMLDWAYFVTGSLRHDVSPDNERSLIESYLEVLNRRGITSFGFEECYRNYLLAKIFTAYNMVSAPKWTKQKGEEFTQLMRRWNERLFQRMPDPGWDELLD